MRSISPLFLTVAFVLVIKCSSGIPFTDRKNAVNQASFAFAKIFQSHMVLQMEPARANIFGFSSSVGATVNAELVTPTKTYTYSATVQPGVGGASGSWIVELDPQNADTPANISVTSQGTTLTLTDVIFGDVWICSGQSNMQFPVSQMFDAAEERADINYPNIRMFIVGDRDSATPLDDIVDIWLPWTSPNSNSIGNFAAVCWVFGKNLHKALGYSIGLVDNSWGGTIIEAWSSPEALAKCGVKSSRSEKQSPSNGEQLWVSNQHRPIDYRKLAKEHDMRLRQPQTNSVIWNGIVHPLLKMTIKGVIWYQGESDSDWGVMMNRYNCTFPAMISDWRKNFNQASNKQTDGSFPFGFVQLAPNDNRPDTSVGFPDIRWHQTADHGFAPNPVIPNTFMAVAIDLPDFASPYGSIHPRYKKEVGDRLSLAGLAVAYGRQEVYQGPYPSKGEILANGVKISYGPSSTLEIKNISGFELLCSNTWTATNISSSDTSSVTLNNVCSTGSSVEGVRYAWRESPCSLKACAVYEKVNELPAPPFILKFVTDDRGKMYLDVDNPVINVVSPKTAAKDHH
ncbi:hypothetical protein BsWGS_03347 [Bradybaena similaris]